MELLRFRPRTVDLHLPNGALVKVEVSDDARRQHVHDQFDRTHATARPDPIAVPFGALSPEVRGRLGLDRLRADRKPTQGRKRWHVVEDVRLWAPLPDDCLVGAS